MKKNNFKRFLETSKKTVARLKKQVENLKKKQEQEYEDAVHVPKKPHEEKVQKVLVEFSLISVAKATLVVLILILLSRIFEQIGAILLILFISILFAAALDPTVDKLQKYKIPRAVSVILIYIILIAAIGFFISQLIPLVASQIIELARSISDLIVKMTSDSNNSYPFSETLQPILKDMFGDVNRDLIIEQIKGNLETLSGELQNIAGNTLGVIVKIFNNIFNFVLVLILTFFLVVDEDGVDEFFISLFPSKHGEYIVEKMEAIKRKVGFWLRGQVILVFVMFAFTLVGLLILGVDYALTLAMMAGIAEFIPVIGPLLAGIPALLVAFNQSPWLALSVLILILVLQQIEGNVIVPLVMKKAVGLSPIIVILSMLMGFSIFGIIGAIIAVPVATSLAIFVNDYTTKKK